MTIGAPAPHVSSHSNGEHDPRFKKTQPEQNAEPNFHQSQRFSSQINFQSKKNFSSQMTYQFLEEISKHAFAAVWASVQTKVYVLSQQVHESLPSLSEQSWVQCKFNFSTDLSSVQIFDCHDIYALWCYAVLIEFWWKSKKYNSADWGAGRARLWPLCDS